MKKREVPRISLTQQEAADSLGLSLSSFRRHVLPRVKKVRIGSALLFSVAELSKWVEDQGTLTGRTGSF